MRACTAMERVVVDAALTDCEFFARHGRSSVAGVGLG